MKNIAVFASGSGTNAENFINFFENSEFAKIELVVTNNPFAGVIQKAMDKDVDCIINLFQSGDDIDNLCIMLDEYQIDFIVLAGFLKLVPQKIINLFPNKIVNIHPALLPKFGGKGMYGNIVHQAVINNKEKESGISIHFVNEFYDEGQIIAQFKCNIDDNENPDTLAKKIHKLEYQHYPQIVENIIKEI